MIKFKIVAGYKGKLAIIIRQPRKPNFHPHFIPLLAQTFHILYRISIITLFGFWNAILYICTFILCYIGI